MPRSPILLLTIAVVLLLLLVFDPSTIWSPQAQRVGGSVFAAENNEASFEPRKNREPKHREPEEAALPPLAETAMAHGFQVLFQAFTPDGKPARGASILLGPDQHPLNEAKTNAAGVLHRRFRGRNAEMQLVWTCRENMSQGTELRRQRIEANKLTRIPVLVIPKRRFSNIDRNARDAVLRRTKIPNPGTTLQTHQFYENRFGWSEFACAGRIEAGPRGSWSSMNGARNTAVSATETITGTLIDVTGQPLQGWDLVFESQNGIPWTGSTQSRSGGRFELKGAPPQPLALAAYPPENVLPALVAERIWPAENLRFRVDAPVRGAVQIGGIGRAGFFQQFEVRLWSESTGRGRWIRAGWDPTPLPAGFYRLVVGGPGLAYQDRGIIEVAAGETVHLGRLDAGRATRLTGFGKRPGLRWVHPEVFSQVGVIGSRVATAMPPGRYLKADGRSILLSADRRFLPQ